MSIPTFPSLIGLGFPVKRRPMFQPRLRHTAVSGKSTTQGTQPFARYAYELAFRPLRSDVAHLELQTLMGFYEFCVATPTPFHFSDPDDNAIVGSVLGSGDTVSTDFAFLRVIGANVNLVQDVTAAGLKIYLNGVQKTLGADFSILTTSQYGTNYAVRFTSPPGAAVAVTADFAYTWLCEFDEDGLDFSKFMDKLWEAGSVKFTSVLQ